MPHNLLKINFGFKKYLICSTKHESFGNILVDLNRFFHLSIKHNLTCILLVEDDIHFDLLKDISFIKPNLVIINERQKKILFLLFRNILKFKFLKNKIISIFFKKHLRFYFSEDLRHLLSLQKPELFFKNHINNDFQRLLKNKIGSYTKIVTLHLRSPYLNKQQRGKDTARNCSIVNYNLALEFLKKKGYTIIRLAEPNTEKNKYCFNILDLEANSKLFEWWCLKQSEFFICSDSGPAYYPFLTNIPALKLNYPDYFLGYPIKKNDISVCKLIYDKMHQKLISFDDQFSKTFRKIRWDLSRVKYIENSEIEILQSVKYMLKNLKNPQPRNSLQNIIDQKLSDQIKATFGSHKVEKVYGVQDPILGLGKFSDYFLKNSLKKIL